MYILLIYLLKYFKLIKERIAERWQGLNFFENVLFVLTVPAEYPEKSIAIMRECAYHAGLLNEIYSTKLKFTTERENIHFLSKIHDYLFNFL